MNDVVAITGVTRGIGRHLAAQFALHGYRVAGCGSNAALAAEVAGELGDGHLVSACDVTSAEAVDAWASDIETRLGSPAIVIANAGVINEPAAAWLTPPDEFAHVMNVNVTGVYNVARAFVPRMIAGGGRMLVNLSSGWGRHASADVAAYCASKFAVEGFTKALAQEVPESLKVFPMSPGVIDTDMLAKCNPGGHAQFGTPEAWGIAAFNYITRELPTETSGTSVSVPF